MFTLPQSADLDSVFMYEEFGGQVLKYSHGSWCCAEEIQTLISMLLKDGHLPVHQLAIACRTHSLGFLSPTTLSPFGALFWRSVCSATASIAENVNVFDRDESEVAEEALIALTPAGCDQWCELIWQHVQVHTHCSDACSGAAGAGAGEAGTSCSGVGERVQVSATFGVAKHLLAAMVACVDFDDDANRKAAMKICVQLVQKTCSLACASLILPECFCCCLLLCVDVGGIARFLLAFYLSV